MRSRTKWAISALPWGRRLPGLRGHGAGFLLRNFASLTSTPQPSLLHARHGCSGSNKSPAITGADLLFISKCLKDKLREGAEPERGSGGVKALVLGLKVDLAGPLGGCCTTLKKWLPIKPAVTNVRERLNCLVKKKARGTKEGNVWAFIAKTNRGATKTLTLKNATVKHVWQQWQKKGDAEKSHCLLNILHEDRLRTPDGCTHTWALLSDWQRGNTGVSPSGNNLCEKLFYNTDSQ